MQLKFNKKQFNAKLYTTFIFWGAILLIGIISFCCSSIKGAEYFHDPKDYYGVYIGYDSYDNLIKLDINETGAVLQDSQSTEGYEYMYMSTTRVQQDFGKEDGCAGIFIYKAESPESGIMFWLYKTNDLVYLRERVTGIYFD